MIRYILILFCSLAALAQNPLQRDLSCSDAGSTDTYACNLAVTPSAYVTGAVYRFKANTANTGAATINLSSLGAKTIKKVAGGVTTDLSDNDIRAGQWVTLVYDGTNMQMQSALGNAAEGGSGISGMTLLHKAGNVTLPACDNSGVQTFYTYTMPGGTAQAGDTIRIEYGMYRLSGGDGAYIKLGFANGQIFDFGSGFLSTGREQGSVEVIVTGSTSATAVGDKWTSGTRNWYTPGGSGSDPTNFDVSTSTAITIKSTAACTDATFKLAYLRITLYRP